ncbi:hypothetical protein A6V25_33955 [Nostoc sp. ATCC 53789]|nr:hypothetical protein A6V25_33955 [Nostoc sp. ATCC 53789]
MSLRCSDPPLLKKAGDLATQCIKRSDCLKSQAIVNKKTWVGALTQQRNAALDSAVSGTG